MIIDTVTPTLTNTDYKDYFEKAIDYSKYKQNFQYEMDSEIESNYAAYLPQNWQRQSRLDRKIKLNEELLVAIKSIKQPLNWLVISEHWCGDASQINPIINRVAEENDGKINLRFLYRDENIKLIDAFLTDGKSRSIPILIQLDSEFNYLGKFGPRPTEAQKLVKANLANQEPYDVPLHTWYAKDKQKSVQDDLAKLLGKTIY